MQRPAGKLAHVHLGLVGVHIEPFTIVYGLQMRQ